MSVEECAALPVINAYTLWSQLKFGHLVDSNESNTAESSVRIENNDCENINDEATLSSLSFRTINLSDLDLNLVEENLLSSASEFIDEQCSAHMCSAHVQCSAQCEQCTDEPGEHRYGESSRI